jgi:hypothetical protein
MEGKSYINLSVANAMFILLVFSFFFFCNHIAVDYLRISEWHKEIEDKIRLSICKLKTDLSVNFAF